MAGEEEQEVLYGDLHEQREDIPPDRITVQGASEERKKEESKKQAKKTLSNSEEASDAYKRQMEDQATRLPSALLQVQKINSFIILTSSAQFICLKNESQTILKRSEGYYSK